MRDLGKQARPWKNNDDQVSSLSENTGSSSQSNGNNDSLSVQMSSEGRAPAKQEMNVNSSMMIGTDRSANEGNGREDFVGAGEKRNVFDATKRGCFSNLANQSNRVLGKKFRTLGEKVGARPLLTVIVMLVIAMICASGCSQIKNENRSEKLWVPTDTRAQEDRIFVDANYGGETRFGSILLKPVNGGDALTADGLNALKAFRDAIESATVVYDGETVTWADQCYRYSKTCAMASILSAFGNDAENWSTNEKIKAKLTQDIVFDSENCGRYDTSIPPACVAGPEIYLNRTTGMPVKTGESYTATSLALQFLMKNFEVVKDGDKQDPRGEAFEKVVLDKIQEVEKTYAATFQVDYAVTRSFGDEFGAAINSDILKLQIALFLILAYATIMLSNGGEGCIGSRVFVSGMGILSIGLAIASSYGLCSYFGLFYSPLMNVLPFLLLGIGVDDMFVLVNAYDNTNPYLSISERLGSAMGTAGLSITVTSFTDIFAFLIGSTTTLPALRNFCFYAALGIFFDYFYQLTFFAAFFALDERRRLQKRGDCFCCPTCAGGETCCVPCCKPPANGEADRVPLTKKAMGFLGNALAPKAMKAFVIVLFLAIFAGGILGVTKIKVEADVQDFIPPGYLRDWIVAVDDTFSRGSAVELYSTTDFDYGADYALGAENSVLLKAIAAFKANEFVQEDTVDPWVNAFNSIGATLGFPLLSGCASLQQMGMLLTTDCTNNSLYADWVYEFVWNPSSPGGYRYRSDIKFDNTTTPKKIIATRTRATQREARDTMETINAMDSIRASIDNIPGNADQKLFAYNEDFLNVEQYKSIDSEAIRNVSLTLTVCFIIIALLIVDPMTVLCVFVSLIMIVINILGYMQHWGLNIDSVTVIMLVIALGLAVDYSAHVGRNFLEKHGEPNQRMILTLQDMGVAVFHGAMSTMVAVLVLGSSDSYVFMTFFKQLFLCITLGLAHGLILLPVCLSLCNPNPYDDLD